MNYLSVCSGIEAATVAWHPLGWRPVAFSEIEAFPSAVLQHHYPDVPNVGDMTKYKEWDFGSKTVDLLVGGTPCQSFSVAGLRKGLEDPRGNLALVYCGILDHFRPKWFVWENVPGVLSSSGGRDFGSFLGALAELGYGFSYRVLDAQYFGVAQRRRRVFVVGHLGDWRPAAEVLFERESLRGDPAPRREAGKGFARTSGTLTANGGGLNRPVGNANELDFCIPTTFDRQSSGEYGTAPVASTISARDYKSPSDLVMPVGTDIFNGAITGDVAVPLTHRSDGTGTGPTVMSNMAVRRLTPIECERLQGFPDNYTDIQPKGKPTADGPRYKALGNSMAVPVMAWIGKRIAEV
jgi:DNA (cytosine-5)-methyltransferase 1